MENGMRFYLIYSLLFSSLPVIQLWKWIFSVVDSLEYCLTHRFRVLNVLLDMNGSVEANIDRSPGQTEVSKCATFILIKRISEIERGDCRSIVKKCINKQQQFPTYPSMGLSIQAESTIHLPIFTVNEFNFFSFCHAAFQVLCRQHPTLPSAVYPFLDIRYSYFSLFSFPFSI